MLQNKSMFQIIVLKYNNRYIFLNKKKYIFFIFLFTAFDFFFQFLLLNSTTKELNFPSSKSTIETRTADKNINNNNNNNNGSTNHSTLEHWEEWPEDIALSIMRISTIWIFIVNCQTSSDPDIKITSSNSPIPSNYASNSLSNETKLTVEAMSKLLKSLILFKNDIFTLLSSSKSLSSDRFITEIESLKSLVKTGILLVIN